MLAGLYARMPCLKDMLQLGNDGLNVEEQKSHFTLWAFINSPLLLGSDITNLDKDVVALLLNVEITALNQDSLGYPGRVTGSAAGTTLEEVWEKKLAGGAVAAVLFNKGDASSTMTVDFAKHLNISASAVVTVRDLWQQSDVGKNVKAGSWSASVPPHGVVVLKVTPQPN